MKSKTPSVKSPAKAMPGKSTATPKTKATATKALASKVSAAKVPPEPTKKSPKKSLVTKAIETVKAAITKRTTRKPAAKAAPAKPAKSIAAPVAPPKAETKAEPKPAAKSAPKADTEAKPKAKKTAAKAAAPKPEPAPEIPAILLEGDEPATPKVTGRGDRYILGPQPPVESFSEGAELPEAYGTGRLVLAARDPHWLYAHWDFTEAQLKTHNRAARNGHLSVRVFENKPGGKPVTEVDVHPESRNWFIHVGAGGRKYVAELGYYKKSGGQWESLSLSRAAMTPPDSLSDDTTVSFATIPVELSFAQLLALLKQAAREHIPLAEAIQQLRLAGHSALPDLQTIINSTWTPEQEAAMAAVLSMDSVRRVWMGSLEITELLRRQMLRELSSIGAAQLGQISSLNVSSLGVSSLSSPYGGAPGKKGFWFNVNAELIIYGATEPDATVTIGGRKIRLRPDGSFSYRFSLPDGNYNLPAIATSRDGDDTRIADLAFSRSTEYRGEVGTHPQDASLRPPKAEHVS
jgi:hypothetical protein